MATKKLKEQKKFCVYVAITEKRRGRKTYSDLFLKQTDGDCDKEMEPSSPLIYNRRRANFSQRKKGYCYLDTEHICNPFHDFITHGNFKNIFLAFFFLRITSLIRIYISAVCPFQK